MPEKKLPLFPVDPVTHVINLPADVVHELFHLAEDSKTEAVKRLIELTGVGPREARDYVEALDRRR
jgi:ribosomal protein L7/L12